MEKQLKFILLLSLKEMALRRVAVLLWSGSDIYKLSEYRSDTKESREEQVEAIEEKVKDKMSKLEIPESLRKQMIDIVRPIGFEINRWESIHHRFHPHDVISVLDLAKLCWTTAGALDYRKGAEEMVRSDKLSVEHRYKIACFYCLEDHIPHLWEELSEEMKEHFYNQKPTEGDLTFFWPHILRGELSKLDYLWRTSDRKLTTFNQYAFEHSAKKCLKTAAEYFFHKLMPGEREASLIRTAIFLLRSHRLEFRAYVDRIPCEKLSDVLCCLLSLMNPEQQMKVYEGKCMREESLPGKVLCYFLDWPRQDLFLENADLICTFLPPSSYADLIWELAKHFRDSSHYSPKLFQEFFLQSSDDFKEILVRELLSTGKNICYFLDAFFKFQDSKSIEVIFRNVGAAERVKIVSDFYFLYHLCKSMSKGEWLMVEVCLREATLSKKDSEVLKVVFAKHLKKYNVSLSNEILQRFFELLEITNTK